MTAMTFMSKFSIRRRSIAASFQPQLIVALVAVAVSTPAQAVLWDGGGVNSEWIEPANWQFNVLPTTADTATITGVIVPPVFAVELGLGSLSGGLVMTGGANPAGLNVVTNVAVAGAGSLTLGGSGPTTSDVAAATLSTSGTVSVLSGGAITLTGQLTQTGGTINLSGGTINAAAVSSQAGDFNAAGDINADVTIGNDSGAIATLAPGASLDVDGNLKLASDARLAVEFRSLHGIGAFDMIDVTETLSLGGVLDLSVLGGAAPAPGVEYPMISAGAIRGGFDDIIGTAVDGGSWIPHLDLDLTGISFSKSELFGNMNGDETVDEQDVELFAYAIRDPDTYHSEFYLGFDVADSHMADMDGDGGNTFADIPLFLDAIELFGGSSEAAMAGIMRVLTPVPEPSSAAMAWALAVVGVRSLRRPQHSRGSPA